MIYGSVEGFCDYHEARGNLISGAWSPDYIQTALLVASEWLDGIYGTSWMGSPVTATQERQWPRSGAYTNTFPSRVFTSAETPEAVEKATYEAAFRQCTTAGSLQKDFTPNKYDSVSVSGAIAVKYNGNNTQAADVQTQFPVIQTLMAPLLNTSSEAVFASISAPASRV